MIPPAPTTGSIVAVCRVHAVLPDAGRVGSTAIDKRPVPGAVAVGPLGIAGDAQRDVEHHGGPDKAVYAYGEGAADAWVEALGTALEPGVLGENLRVAGLDVDAALIGERWQVGRAGLGPLLEVASPRIPCQTFARFLADRLPEADVGRWVRRFTAAGRPGAYLRVVEPGVLAAGDPVQVVSRPDHGVSITSWFLGQDDLGGSAAQARALLDAEAAGQVRLAAAVREGAERALARPAAVRAVVATMTTSSPERPA